MKLISTRGSQGQLRVDDQSAMILYILGSGPWDKWHYHIHHMICAIYPIRYLHVFDLWIHYINSLVQERCNSSALAMELHLSCTNPSICYGQWAIRWKLVSQRSYDICPYHIIDVLVYAMSYMIYPCWCLLFCGYVIGFCRIHTIGSHKYFNGWLTGDQGGF